MKGEKLGRRDFVKAATLFATGFPTILVARQPKTFRIALIGCGGRGMGAVRDAFEAAKLLGVEVKVVACGDWFRERALRAGKEFGVEPNRCFGGPTAYREVLETEAEIVLIATAPAFHPVFVEAAIKAGKHLFVEKPVAVDPVGCRRVIAAGKEAEQKGLVAIAGTEMRHDFNFRLTHQAVAVEGALGRLYGGRIAFCIGHMFATKPINPKTPDDLIRTWQNWVCLSGDHIVEQHIHNIDVANWFVGRPPVSAVGFRL
jgi:predicted dehydrogenase